MGTLLALAAQAQEPANNDSLHNALDERITELEATTKKASKLKISGYIQANGQWGQKDASLKVGGKNDQKDDDFMRLGIRRGRVKFTYTDGLATGVFQLDITESGVGMKDAYANLKLPFYKSSSIQAGVFDRPFGHEISYSSSRRESPERSQVFQTLFPGERDLGAMLTLQAHKESAWNFLKLQAGLFAGNGINKENDNTLDFIGHLTATRTIGNSIEWGVGASLYQGSIRQGSSKVYTMGNNGFELNDSKANVGARAKRQYFGVDGQLNICTSWGVTRLRAEWLTGTQPASKDDNGSPKSSALPTFDTYSRNFQGGYALFSQDWGTTPFSTIIKYDWYDPNTKLSGDQLDTFANVGKGDIKYSTLGLGAIARLTKDMKLTAYYEIVNNETSVKIADKKDNRFTLSLQYKF